MKTDPDVVSHRRLQLSLQAFLSCSRRRFVPYIVAGTGGAGPGASPASDFMARVLTGEALD